MPDPRGNAPTSSSAAPRRALGHIDINADAAARLVTVRYREQFAISATEVPIPFSVIKTLAAQILLLEAQAEQSRAVDPATTAPAPPVAQ